MNQALGWFRLAVLLIPSLACLWLYWQEPNLGLALLWLLAGTLIYSLLMISTHDISHATLLHMGSFEQAVGCALSWPVGGPTSPTATCTCSITA